MNTAILLIIIWIMFSFLVAGVPCLFMLYRSNQKLSEQLEEREWLSINQGCEIIALQGRLGILDEPNQELMDRIYKELDKDEDQLIFMEP